jgi:hypothetical protein
MLIVYNKTMKDVRAEVKVSQFRQHLFEWLDASRTRTITIVRGKERYRLVAEPARKPLGSAAPLPGLAKSPEALPEFSPAEWRSDGLS